MHFRAKLKHVLWLGDPKASLSNSSEKLIYKMPSTCTPITSGLKLFCSFPIGLITLVKDKILGLPWDCIISLITNLALIGGTTFAFWSLTEDNAVLAIPALQLLGPFLLTKIQEKSWLDAKQVHLGNELLTTAILGEKNQKCL